MALRQRLAPIPSGIEVGGVRLHGVLLAAGSRLRPDLWGPAVVIRTLLVPALVLIMGRWNGWLPAGLARVLQVRK